MFRVHYSYFSLAMLALFRYDKTEFLRPGGPKQSAFTHLIVEAKNRHSFKIRALAGTHEILDFVEGFSSIRATYSHFPPIRIKTKPCLFILKAKNQTTDAGSSSASKSKQNRGRTRVESLFEEETAETPLEKDPLDVKESENIVLQESETIAEPSVPVTHDEEDSPLHVEADSSVVEEKLSLQESITDNSTSVEIQPVKESNVLQESETIIERSVPVEIIDVEDSSLPVEIDSNVAEEIFLLQESASIEIQPVKDSTLLEKSETVDRSVSDEILDVEDSCHVESESSVAEEEPLIQESTLSDSTYVEIQPEKDPSLFQKSDIIVEISMATEMLQGEDSLLHIETDSIAAEAKILHQEPTSSDSRFVEILAEKNPIVHQNLEMVVEDSMAIEIFHVETESIASGGEPSADDLRSVEILAEMDSLVSQKPETIVERAETDSIPNVAEEEPHLVPDAEPTADSSKSTTSVSREDPHHSETDSAADTSYDSVNE